MPPKKQQTEQPELPEIAAPEIEAEPDAAEPAEPEKPVEAEGDDNPLRTVAIEAMVSAGLDRETAELAYAAAQEAVMDYVNDHPEAVSASDVVIPPSALGTSGDICRECFGDGWNSPNAKDFVSVGCVHGHWTRS